MKAATVNKRAKVLSSTKKAATLKNILISPSPSYDFGIECKELEIALNLLNKIFRTGYKTNSYGKKSTLFAEKEYLIHGLRSVMRSLQSGSTSFALLSTSIQPMVVQTQIIDNSFLCNPNVCIACIPNLEELLKKVFGFNCLAIGFKSTLSSETIAADPDLSLLVEWIKRNTLHKINLNSKEIQNAKPVKTKRRRSICRPDDNLRLPKSAASNERAFVPKINSKSKTQEFKLQTSEDFISVSDSIEIDIPDAGRKLNALIERKKKRPDSKQTSPYVPLTIHKIRPNPTKSKRNK